MTGKYNVRNYVKFGYLDTGERTFAHQAKEAGYATCIAGKWQLGGGEDAPQHFGFDESLLWQQTRGRTRPKSENDSRYENPRFERNGRDRKFETMDYDNGEYGPQLMADFVCDFITRHKDQPFLAYYPMILPHWPFSPTPDSPDWNPASKGSVVSRGPGTNEDRSRHFVEMVAYVDKLVGQIVRRLDDLGLRDNTIIFFTGDNGTATSIVTQFQGQAIKGGKHSMTDAGTRVPLIVSWPGHFARSQTSNDLVDFADMLPTLAEMMAAAFLVSALVVWFVPTAFPADTNETLAATFTDQGAIRSLTWSQPNVAPINLVFRQDKFAGFSWHVNVGGTWSTQLPLVRVQPGRDEFTLSKNGVMYSLAYTATNGILKVVAKIKNDSGKPFSPDRALVNVGIDTEMAQYPDWNQRFFPTLLRCEKTHFWGYFMRPDGIVLGIASPDPVVSWANGYNDGGHRIFTTCLDLLNKNPQPARHSQVSATIAPGETRQWSIFLVPSDTLEKVPLRLSTVAAIPIICLDRPTAEA